MITDKPDVIIIKPGGQKKVYGNLNAFNLTAIEPPLWGALIAGHLRWYNFKVAMIDEEVWGWSHTETAKYANYLDPIAIIISVSGSNPQASTMNMDEAISLIKEIQNFTFTRSTILHGLHPSALPERSLRESNADFIVKGEGFRALPDLINRIKNGNTTKLDINGVHYLDHDDRYVSNIYAHVHNRLDELPIPAWDLLPMENYRAHNWHCMDDINNRQPYGVIYTSLGCPYSCNFCCINAMFGKPSIRYLGVEKVLEQIDFLVENYGIKNIKIMDELFALNENRTVKICDAIAKRKYDLNMWAYGRVTSVTDRMLNSMRGAGIKLVAYGMESGSDYILDGVSKNSSVEDIWKAVRMTYDADMRVGANFIFGLPKDDFHSMQETLSLAIEINAEWVNFYSAMAYPGSKLYDDMISRNVQLPKEWISYSQYSYECEPLATEYLSSADVLEFRDYAFQTYFTNPRYLNRMSAFYGEDIVTHIKDMTSHKLKRKILGD